MPIEHEKPVEGRRWMAPFRRFRSATRGSVAIEFTMLALPFSLLIFAVLESSISFAGQQVLANAADDVGRLLRTGQIKQADATETNIRNMICSRISVLVESGCPGLSIDLQEYPTFAAAAAVRTKYTSDRDIDTTGFKVAPGKSLSKNMLRVFYRWPVITDLMRASMSNLKGGKTLQFATTTWQNEPFDD